MIKAILSIISLIVFCSVKAFAQGTLETDIIKTSSGDLEIIFIGHGSLLFKYADKIFYVDPYSELSDYSKLPKADVVFVTHDHPDHLDLKALNNIRGKNTMVIISTKCLKQIPEGIVLKIVENRTTFGVNAEAVPAYNIVHRRNGGNVFHPKGEGNGYVLTFGDKRIYVAGDTENIPEMKSLKNIDIAFLPMNLPYTMTPQMTADAANSFNPKILYPYHYGNSDTSVLQDLLKGRNVEVRIRNMR